MTGHQIVDRLAVVKARADALFPRALVADFHADRSIRDVCRHGEAYPARSHWKVRAAWERRLEWLRVVARARERESLEATADYLEAWNLQRRIEQAIGAECVPRVP